MLSFQVVLDDRDEQGALEVRRIHQLSHVLDNDEALIWRSGGRHCVYRDDLWGGGEGETRASFVKRDTGSKSQMKRTREGPTTDASVDQEKEKEISEEIDKAMKLGPLRFLAEYPGVMASLYLPTILQVKLPEDCKEFLDEQSAPIYSWVCRKTLKYTDDEVFHGFCMFMLMGMCSSVRESILKNWPDQAGGFEEARTFMEALPVYTDYILHVFTDPKSGASGSVNCSGTLVRAVFLELQSCAAAGILPPSHPLSDWAGARDIVMLPKRV